LPGAKFTLRPKSCVLLYWQRYCTALEQLASAKICGVLYKEWNCGTFAEGATYIRLGGHHVGHRPTFSLHLKKIVTGNSLVKDMVYGRKFELPGRPNLTHNGDHLFKNVGDIRMCLKINHSVV